MSVIPGALLSTLTICTLAVPSPSQINWFLFDDDASFARIAPGTSADPTGGEFILFGGLRSPASNLSDTWGWNGNAWNRISTASRPLGRHSFGMCPDGTRGVLLFAGASDPTAVLPDTWRYANGDWQQLFPATVPTRRMAHGMAAIGDGVVLFGGHNRITGQRFGDTWVWDGTNWTQRSPAQSPSPRSAHAMASDPIHDRVVLYGGRNMSTGAFLGDTWVWDGTNWTQMTPATSPPPLAAAAMAYDPVRERMVLFGGANPFESAETWEWDGETWIRRYPGEDLPPRSRAGMFYDSRREIVVMVGGGVTFRDGDSSSLADTWVYSGTSLARITTTGAGCPGSAGTPNLSPVLRQRPWLGETFSLQLTGLPPGSPPLLLIGLSNTGWGPMPLPYPLDSLGLPGCTAYTSADAAIPLVNLAGTAVWTARVPPDFALVGRSAYAQAVVPDATANAFGATVSNAVEIVFGMK